MRILGEARQPLKVFVITGDVIWPCWRHHLLKMPTIGGPFWGVRLIFCHLSHACLQTSPKLPFFPDLFLIAQISPIFYISGLESGIDLKFGPGLDIDNPRLHAPTLWKFLPLRTRCWKATRWKLRLPFCNFFMCSSSAMIISSFNVKSRITCGEGH